MSWPKGKPRKSSQTNGDNRQCSACGEWKHESLFTPSVRCIRGISFVCRSCNNARWEKNKMDREGEERRTA